MFSIPVCSKYELEGLNSLKENLIFSFKHLTKLTFDKTEKVFVFVRVFPEKMVLAAWWVTPAVMEQR